MKPHLKRLLNLLLVAVLALTVAPWGPGKATAAPVPSLYFQFRDFSIDNQFPTDVNSNITDIAGTYFDVTSSTISYKVEQITISGGNTNVVQTSIGSTKPVISGFNFTFAGVSLYPGLNRITVTGTNSTGNVVSGQAFVNFSNVPAMTAIELADGRDLLSAVEPLITDNVSEGFTVRAPNSTEVTVNGKQMFPGANSTYVISNIGLARGSNKLTFIAKNANKSYEVTKYVVYYDGNLTAYDVKIDTTSIDGNPQITGTDLLPLTGKITAKVIVPQGTTLANNSIQFAVGAYLSAGTTITGPVNGPTYDVFTVTDNGAGPTITATGNYTLTTTDLSNVSSTPFQSKFSYRNTNAPFINDIKQAFGMTVNGANAAYSSYGSFPNNSTVNRVPLWLFLDTTNFDASASTTNVTTVTAKQNGVTLTSAQFAYAVYGTGTGNKWPAIQITKMPSGNVDLTFTITFGGNSDTITRAISFYPVASIQVDSIYDGKVFNNQLTAADLFEGQLINFDLTNDAELDTLMLNFNGTDYPLVEAYVSGTTEGPQRLVNGGFSFNPRNTPVGGLVLNLVVGPNTLIFKGVAGGIPISTTLTVYYFPNTNPSVSAIRPVPFVIDPANDNTLPLKRAFGDSQNKFAITGTKEFTTTETKLDLLFDFKNVSNMTIQMDGQTIATMSTVTNTAPTPDQLQISDPNPTDQIKVVFEVVDSSGVRSVSDRVDVGVAGTLYTLRITGDKGVPLPQSGGTNFTVTAGAASDTVIENVTIIRDLSPYIVLSPRFPEESVINSNFIKVSIKAEGADKVLIGKTEMIKGTGDIFRYEVKNLKAGANTISFTVMQGTQKINGKVSVTYAADNSLSAQYKAPLPKSGKISMFKNDLTVSFPKNTFLRQANANPGQDVKTVDLFDSQELYFGIADSSDGRTVKKYNAVGEFDSVTQSYQDGNMVLVDPNTTAISRLRPKSNFDLASNLYWIDAGYFVPGPTPTSPFTLADAMSPYSPSNDMFYLRAMDPNKWLEPSQRGTITIKYDPDIRDALATNLSVWRYIGQEWQNIGGVVNTKNKTVTAPFDGFGYYAVMALRYSYSDVITHSYARFAVESMFSHGIMINKDNNSFGVYDNITRGEFAQILVKILDIPLDYDPNNMTFDDVLPLDYPGALWNYRYIETAAKKGFIRGKSPRLFLPNDPLTREEAAIMIARAFNMLKSNADADKDKAALQKQFTDGGEIDVYASSAVLAVVKAKYMSGIPNTTPAKTNRFEPHSYLDRAQAAVMATKIMQALKKL